MRAVECVVFSMILAYGVCVVFSDGPKLDLGKYNPLKVIERDPVTLTCSVDANPEVEADNVQWYKGTTLKGRSNTQTR